LSEEQAPVPIPNRKTHLTTREFSERYDEPAWRVREAADALGELIPRAGLYRLIPLEAIDLLRAEIRRQKTTGRGKKTEQVTA
jgi:hypothetical protein